MSDVADDTDRWIQGEMAVLAREMGVGTLPRQNPEVSLYGMVRDLIRHQGIEGQDLDHATHRVIQDLFFNASTGDRGPVYNYPEYYRKTGKAFDSFFQFLAQQRSMNLYRKKFFPKNRSDDRPVEERAVEDPRPEWEDLSTNQASRILREMVPRLLLEQRDGDLLNRLWTLWLGGAKLQEIAAIFNREGVTGPRGGSAWVAGTVYRYRERIIELVKNYLGMKGLTPEDFRNLGIGG